MAVLIFGAILSFALSGVAGIAGWALLTTIKQGQEISKLQVSVSSEKEENNRRFGELSRSLHDIRNLLQRLVLSRRREDHERTLFDDNNTKI